MAIQSFTKTAMATLWEEVAESTSINLTLSRWLNKWDMDDLSDMGRTADSAPTAPSSGDLSDTRLNNAQDVEWIPQDYRFDVQDGIVSSDTDFQDLIDRNIPVYRRKSKRVLAQLNTRDLRDPMRRQKKMLGMARDIANAIDIECYQTMLRQATMVVASNNFFTYQDAINAETLMLNRGLSAFNRNLYLANTDYNQIAKSLGQNQYYGSEGGVSLTKDALVRASIPPLATFDTKRSDYLLSVDAPAVLTGWTVLAASTHSIKTFNASGFYNDNRYGTITVAQATPNVTVANFPVGTKFVIADVNALNEESRTNTGSLQTFTVVGVAAVSGQAKQLSLTISPQIIPDTGVFLTNSPYRNCDKAAVAGAVITIINSMISRPSLFFTPESTVLIPGRLPIPQDAGGVEVMEATTDQGIPMRMTYWYDPHKEVFNCKALVFFDVQCIYPNQVGAIYSKQTTSYPSNTPALPS